MTALPGANVGSIMWRQDGRVYLTVVVKASYAFVPGGVMVSIAPQPILHPSTSTPHDLVLFQQEADVWLSGHVPAPATAPVRFVLYRGGTMLIDKSADLSASRPPLGSGYLPLTAFGPICPSVQLDTAAYLVDIADDLPFDALQCAPPDQRVPTLVGDEWIGLSGVARQHTSFATQLPTPKAQARVYTMMAPGFHKEIELYLGTLSVDVDRRLCSLSWRGQMPLDVHAMATTHIVAGVERPGGALRWLDPFASRSGAMAGAPPSATPTQARQPSSLSAPMMPRAGSATTPLPRPPALGLPPQQQPASTPPPASCDMEAYASTVQLGAGEVAATVPDRTAALSARQADSPPPSSIPAPKPSFSGRVDLSADLLTQLGIASAPARAATPTPPSAAPRSTQPRNFPPIHPPSVPPPSVPPPSVPAPSVPPPSVPPPHVPAPPVPAPPAPQRASAHLVAPRAAPPSSTPSGQPRPPRLSVTADLSGLEPGDAELAGLPFDGAKPNAAAPEPLFNDFHEALSGTSDLTHDAWAAIGTQRSTPFSKGAPARNEAQLDGSRQDLSDGQHFLAAAAALDKQD